MREMRMTGSNEKELKSGIKFILNNLEYDKKIEEITHIIVEDRVLYAFSFTNGRLDNEPGKLPISIDSEGFASMVSLWWSKQEMPEIENYCDGTIEKGFILSSGRNWGNLNIDNDFGIEHVNDDLENDAIIKLKNLACITIAVNVEEWGK